MHTLPSPAIHSYNVESVASTSNSGSDLRQLCDELWARISAFLEEEDEEIDGSVVHNAQANSHLLEQQQDEGKHRALLGRARAQTKVSLGVIEEALNQYR